MARGDLQPSRDFDSVVQFDAGRSFLDHGGLQMDWQELLSCRVYVVSEKSLRDRMRGNVGRDAVDL